MMRSPVGKSEKRANRSYTLWDNKLTQSIIIKISDQKTVIVPSSNAFCYQTYVLVNDNKVDLRSLDSDSALEVNSNGKYEITFEDFHRQERRFFKLPSLMNYNLFCFLTGGKRKKENCMDFINAIYFGCGTIKINDLSMVGDPSIIDNIKDLMVGQAVAIGNKSSDDLGIKINHYAIYIGNNLFISTPGENPLIITTLEQMQLLYKSNCVAKISPARPVSEPTHTFNI